MSSPYSRIAPELGFSAPEIMFSMVVLPEPFGPISPSTSFSARSNEMPSTATRPPKRLLTPSTASAVIARCSGMAAFPALQQAADRAMAPRHEVFDQADHAARDEIDDEQKARAQQDRGLCRELGGDELPQQSERDHADQRTPQAMNAAE